MLAHAACTLQDVALIDARRGANMFRKIHVPLLGIVENMSHYQCPACGHKEHIFGHEGAIRTAEAMNMDFLGQVRAVHFMLMFNAHSMFLNFGQILFLFHN